MQKSGATSDNLVEQGAISALVPILDELVVINVANWIPTKLPTPSTQLFNRYYDFVQTLLRSSPVSISQIDVVLLLTPCCRTLLRAHECVGILFPSELTNKSPAEPRHHGIRQLARC